VAIRPRYGDTLAVSGPLRAERPAARIAFRDHGFVASRSWGTVVSAGLVPGGAGSDSPQSAGVLAAPVPPNRCRLFFSSWSSRVRTPGYYRRQAARSAQGRGSGGQTCPPDGGQLGLVPFVDELTRRVGRRPRRARWSMPGRRTSTGYGNAVRGTRMSPIGAMLRFSTDRPGGSDRLERVRSVTDMHRHRAPFLPGTPLPARVRHAATLIDFEELAPLIADDRVTDVLVLGGRGVWTDRGSGLDMVPGLVLPEERARDLARSLVARGGRHVDETTPCADVRHGDGIRVHAVLAPVSVHGTAISIRLPLVERPTITRLTDSGFFEHIPRSVVERVVHERRNVLVTGATGSGKTTLLAAMLALVPDDERIITVEDVAELRIDHPHVVALETRQANAEGAGALGLDRLVREALRMRPDRLVVGECRGAEIRELTSALNTGHDGGAGTVHANGLHDVAARLEALGALAGLGATQLARQAASAFDLVLHVERRNGIRRLAAVGRFDVDPSGRLEVTPVGSVRVAVERGRRARGAAGHAPPGEAGRRATALLEGGGGRQSAEGAVGLGGGDGVGEGVGERWPPAALAPHGGVGAGTPATVTTGRRTRGAHRRRREET
jgi:secretion/DNA translocation related ATPase